MSTNPAASQIVSGLLQITAFARSRQWQSGQALNLTPTQIGVLRVLMDHGPTQISRVGQFLGVTQATASDAISSLESKGLLARKADPNDARARLAHLTPDGRHIALARHEVPLELVAAFEQCDEADQAGLLRGLTLAIRHLQETGGIQPQRLCVTCRFFRPNVHGDPAAPHHCAFVDAAFGDASLRLDCGEHEPADASETDALWRRFLGAPAGQADAPPAATGAAS
ncbi:MAG: MarR family winged helix-turn-helix transcriptional regulator [Hyphomicrobiaceae bacterium]